MNMHSNRRTTQSPHIHSLGFTLVELMVALVITLILLAGIGQIFLSSKKSFNIQDSLARMQENGRYATETLVQDLRRAGYWGGNADINKIVDYTQGGADSVLAEDGTCSSDLNDTSWARMLTHKVFGKDDNWTYGCIPGTHVGDVLTVRYAAPWLVGGTTTPDFENNMIYLRSSLFESALFKGDDIHPVPRAIRTAELVSRGYYINPSSPSANRCPGNQAVPSLNRVTLNRGDGKLRSEEVALGVENLQVQYGLDTDAVPDNSVDQYVDAMVYTDPRWDKVIAVRLWLLVRAECPETGFSNTRTYDMGNQSVPVNDAYRRQLYTTTVMLRNR